MTDNPLTSGKGVIGATLASTHPVKRVKDVRAVISGTIRIGKARKKNDYCNNSPVPFMGVSDLWGCEEMTNLEWIRTLSAEEFTDWLYNDWLDRLQYLWSSSRGGLIIWLKGEREGVSDLWG